MHQQCIHIPFPRLDEKEISTIQNFWPHETQLLMRTCFLTWFPQNLGLNLVGCSQRSQRGYTSMTNTLKAALHAFWKPVPPASILLQQNTWESTVQASSYFLLSESRKPACLTIYGGFKGLGKRWACSWSSIQICWINEWKGEYMMNHHLWHQVTGGFPYYAWDICHNNSAKVYKTNSAFQLLPSLPLETGNTRTHGSSLITIIINSPGAQSKSYLLLLSSFSEFNVLTVSPQHPAGKRRGLCPNRENWQMRGEK